MRITITHVLRRPAPVPAFGGAACARAAADVVTARSEQAP